MRAPCQPHNMPRPKGRRTWHKAALFDSELESLLELAPEGATDIQRVAQLCREVACGEWRVVEVEGAETSEPRELARARAERTPGQKGRTPVARTRRDVLFYPREFERFMARCPEGLSFQEVLRGLSAGALALEADEYGRVKLAERVAANRCELCGHARTDAAPYCLGCRTAKAAA